MAEFVRKIDWLQIPYETRFHINGPTTAVYSMSNLPFEADPGWSSWEKDGEIVRAINIHGPFATAGHEESDRCEDGWLVVDGSGFVSAVESEYVKPSENTSELEEWARPHGYKEVI